MRERPAFYGILSGHHDRQIVAKIEHLLAQHRVVRVRVFDHRHAEPAQLFEEARRRGNAGDGVHAPPAERGWLEQRAVGEAPQPKIAKAHHGLAWRA